MSSVKHNALRTARQAARTEVVQAAIVQAAEALFLKRGYVLTTLEDIAVQAGVAIQTVYNTVGPKAALLSAMLDRAAAGPSAAKSVPAFMRERVAATVGVEGMVQVLADWFSEVQPRVARVQAVIDEAAAVDAEIRKLAQVRAAQRYKNYIEAGRAVKERGGAPSASPEELAASIWTIGHPNAFRFFHTQQGWSMAQYRAWVERNLRAIFS